VSAPDVLRAALPGHVLLRATGADRVSFLHRMLTCDVKGVPVGGTTCGLFLTRKGKVTADFVLAVRPDRVELLAPPAARPGLRDGLARFVVADDVVLEEVALPIATLLGPGAAAAAAALPEGILRFPRTRCGLPAVDVAGEFAMEADLSAEGLETLRVEAGEPLLGAEATEETLPQECGLDGLVSYVKGCFLGQEPVARLHAQGRARRGLAGLVLGPGAPVPERGTPVLDGDREAGTVTSAVFSTALGRPVALALLRVESAAPGTRLLLGAEAGTVAALPFV
jgi:folate-binding protein YgfZ